MPKCVICGHEAKSLQPHLKHSHHMTVAEYKQNYNAPVYDYNPADRLQKWAEENPEEYIRKQSEGGKAAVDKMNQYLSDNPEVRTEIARKGGEAVKGRNLIRWRQETDPEVVSSCCAKAGHMSSISKGHEFMARKALENNRYCKYEYFSDKFGMPTRKYASKWEANFIRLCETIDSIQSLVHEPFGINYLGHDGETHKYYPDFLVNGSILVEIKPEGRRNEYDVVIKKEAAENYCTDHDYSYIILTEAMLSSIRNGEITTSAQQELLKLLKI